MSKAHSPTLTLSSLQQRALAAGYSYAPLAFLNSEISLSTIPSIMRT
jgi:hypothetical protein